MPRNKEKFKQDVKSIMTKASKAAHKAAFNTPTNDDESFDSLTEKIATEFANKFAEVLLPEFANIIDDYLDSQMFDVSKLTAGGSTVSGILKSI